MSTTRDVLLVLAGAAGSAGSGALTAWFQQRREQRAWTREHLVAVIDREAGMWGRYLEACENLAARMDTACDEVLVPGHTPREQLDVDHQALEAARFAYQMQYWQVALSADDSVATALMNVDSTVTVMWDWTLRLTAGELPEDEKTDDRKSLQLLAIHDASVSLVDSIRLFHTSLLEQTGLS